MHQPSTTAMQYPFAAYVCSDQGAAVAREVVDQAGAGEEALRGGGLSGAARLSESAPIAPRLLTELGNLPVETACESVAEIRRSGAEVIVMGHQSDLGIYRALRNAGATDYFCFPVTADEILAAEVPAPANTPSVPKPENRPPAIAVTGACGGVGASLLAQNLAFYAANPRGMGRKTALVDADLQFGSQALNLDLDETPGFIEALTAPSRVDETFLSSTMGKIHEGLSYYTQSEMQGQTDTVLEGGFAPLTSVLRESFGAIVIDLPRDLLLHPTEITRPLDALVMVIPAGFTGVNAAGRLLRTIRGSAPDLRIIPVLTELRKDAGLSRKEITRALEIEFTCVLPRCDAAMARSHRTARPLAVSQPRSKYMRSVATVWHSGSAKTPDTKSGRMHLFRRAAS